MKQIINLQTKNKLQIERMIKKATKKTIWFFGGLGMPNNSLKNLKCKLQLSPFMFSFRPVPQYEDDFLVSDFLKNLVEFVSHINSVDIQLNICI